MSTTESERYVRITLLTFEGGIWISKEILFREIDRTPGSPTIDALLLSKKQQLTQKRNRREITKRQYETLFPVSGVDTDVDEWDLSLLIKVVLFLFQHSLPGQEGDHLNEILRIRNEVVCHARHPSVQEHDFNTHWTQLTLSICSLTSAFDVSTKKYASDLVQKLSRGPLDLQSSIERVAQLCRNDEHMEHVLASLSTLQRRLNEVATGVVDANLKLDGVLAAVRELIRIHKTDMEGQCRMEIPNEGMRVCQQTAPVQYRNLGPCITNHDVQTQTRIRYDAFVISVSSDSAVLRRLINIAEGTHGLKLLVPERDILFGLPEYDTWAYAIEKRCKKLLILVSREFMRSERGEFVVRFAQAVSPAARNTKIIPIMVGDTVIPQTSNFVKCSKLRSGDCWDLLIAATRAPSHMERSVSDPDHFAMVEPLPRVPNVIDIGSQDDEDQFVAGMAHLAVTERHSAPETTYRRTHPQMVEESQPNVARNPPGTSFHLGSDDRKGSVLSDESSFGCVRAENQDGVLINLNITERIVDDNNASGIRVFGELNDSARGAERRPLSDYANIRCGDGEANARRVGDSMRNNDNAFDNADDQGLNATTRNMRDRRRPVTTATVVYRSDTSLPDNQTVDKRNPTVSGDLPACHSSNTMRYQTVGLNTTSPTNSRDTCTFQYAPIARQTSSQVGRIPGLRQNSNETNERQEESPDIITYV